MPAARVFQQRRRPQRALQRAQPDVGRAERAHGGHLDADTVVVEVRAQATGGDQLHYAEGVERQRESRRAPGQVRLHELRLDRQEVDPRDRRVELGSRRDRVGRARARAASRLRVCGRYSGASSRHAAEQLHLTVPGTAQKLRLTTPHRLGHTHAPRNLEAGDELTTVRDNLRHASVATTSVYPHADQARRARQMREAFGT